MFIRAHTAFEQKLEGRKYQNAITLVAMAIEKYSWNIMLSRKPDNLDDSYFSRNLVLLVYNQTADMAFQLEVQIYIRDVTEKVKIKATLHSLGGRFESICTQ